MKGVFLGTPTAAVASLAATADIIDVELVVTQPDAPRGRSAKPMPSPIKLAAIEWGIPVAQPASHDELLETLASVHLDVGVVVAYGRLLRPDVLQSTIAGFVNVHFSLLPRWRGAAPVERAILAGDDSTGVSLMHLDAGLDTGPVIAAIETPISSDETAGSLTARLSYLGAEMIDEALPGYLGGDLMPAAQMEGGATMAPRITTAEAELSAEMSWDVAQRMIRAFRPRPGAWFVAEGERYKVGRAQQSPLEVPPGELWPFSGQVVMGFRDGAIEILEIQPPGKQPQVAGDWMNGRRGEVLRLEETG